jgi:hypothetical protein
LTRAEGRRFGMTVGLAFCGLGALLWWRGRAIGSVTALCLGAVLIVAGVTIGEHLGPVYRGWMKLGLAISTVTTPIILAVLYFGVFTPIGWIKRATGHDTITTKEPHATVWTRRPRGASDLRRQF